MLAETADTAIPAVMIVLMALSYTAPIWLLLAAWLIGRSIERKHIRDLERREADVGRRIMVMGHEELPPGVTATQGAMVLGTVVIGVDHFKRFLASWRTIFGGEMRSITPVLMRARREATLRMLEQADRMGANFVVNIRLETADIKTHQGGKQKSSMVEVLAFGTAVQTRMAPV